MSTKTIRPNSPMFSVNLADSLRIHYYYSPITSEFTPVGLRTYLEVVSIFGKPTGIPSGTSAPVTSC